MFFVSKERGAIINLEHLVYAKLDESSTNIHLKMTDECAPNKEIVLGCKDMDQAIQLFLEIEKCCEKLSTMRDNKRVEK